MIFLKICDLNLSGEINNMQIMQTIPNYGTWIIYPQQRMICKPKIQKYETMKMFFLTWLCRFTRGYTFLHRGTRCSRNTCSYTVGKIGEQSKLFHLNLQICSGLYAVTKGYALRRSNLFLHCGYYLSFFLSLTCKFFFLIRSHLFTFNRLFQGQLLR